MTRWIYTTVAAILAVLLVTVTGSAVGQESWSVTPLKKTNPRSLYYNLTWDSKCPGPKFSYERIIEGVMVRDGINPLKQLERLDDVFLDVQFSCKTLVAEIMVLWRVDVYFSKYYFIENSTDGRYTYAVMFLPNYGAVGVGPLLDMREGYASTAKVQDQIRQSVSNALTNYLKANQFP